MILEWLELLMWVLCALVVWLGCAIVIASTESQAGASTPQPEGQARDVRRPAGETGIARTPFTSTPPAAPRLYSNVVHDHRDHGDEDPPRYYSCRKCGAQFFRARDGLRCPNCGLVAGRFAEPEDSGPVGLGVARPAYVKRRRDGVQVSDEVQAELMRKIFGERE